jgi:hypothetical protein
MKLLHDTKLGVVVPVFFGACVVVGGARAALLRISGGAARGEQVLTPHKWSAATRTETREALHVPHTGQPIPINAETEGKPVWEGTAGSTLNFKDQNGKGMVPYTEAKLRWGDGKLYLLLYAGDLDIEAKTNGPEHPLSEDDSFHLEIGGPDRVHVIDVSVLGTMMEGVCPTSEQGGGPIDLNTSRCDRAWKSSAVVAVDRDGTLNRVGDNDEEWVVEIALPLETLGFAGARPGTRMPFAIRRCEVSARGPGQCGSWGMGSPRAPRAEVIFDP